MLMHDRSFVPREVTFTIADFHHQANVLFLGTAALHCLYHRNALRICTALALLSLTLIISFNFDKSGIPLTHQMRAQGADV